MTILVNFSELFKLKLPYLFTYNLELPNIFGAPKIKNIHVNTNLGKVFSVKKDKDNFIENQFLLFVNDNLLGFRKRIFARQSNSSFGIRRGESIGLKTVLHKIKMYQVLTHWLNIVFFINKKFISILNATNIVTVPNFNVGFRDITIFPNIQFDKRLLNHGISVGFTFFKSNLYLIQLFLNYLQRI